MCQNFFECSNQLCKGRQSNHGVQRKMISVDIFFVFLKFIIFCFVVAICDLVHAVEATYGLPKVLTASGNIFYQRTNGPVNAHRTFFQL